MLKCREHNSILEFFLHSENYGNLYKCHSGVTNMKEKTIIDKCNTIYDNKGNIFNGVALYISEGREELVHIVNGKEKEK